MTYSAEQLRAMPLWELVFYFGELNYDGDFTTLREIEPILRERCEEADRARREKTSP